MTGSAITKPSFESKTADLLFDLDDKIQTRASFIFARVPY